MAINVTLLQNSALVAISMNANKLLQHLSLFLKHYRVSYNPEGTWLGTHRVSVSKSH